MYKRIIAAAAALFTLCSAQVNAAYNKYNEEDYINFNNDTIEEVAASVGMTLDEFKAEFNLPEDMPGDTMETAAYFNLTVNDFAALQGSDVNEFIEKLSEMTDNEITPDMLYKEAEAGITFNNYLKITEGLNEDEFEEFYEACGIKNITDETSFAEGRIQIHRNYLAQLGSLGYFAPDSILVMLNGKYLDFDVEPMIINDRVMVPMRSVLEKLGSVVSWDDDTKTVFANKGDKIVTMQVGQNYLFLNDKKIEIDSPAVIVDGRTLIPVRAAAEALETQVFYNENTKTVVIH